jgi:aspartate-semialdehyde dehydrogenase
MAIMDNVIPYIGGEDEKLENEPRKLLGRVVDQEMVLADLQLSAQANRVPVMDGHLASVSVKLRDEATAQQAVEELETWQAPEVCAELPSSPQRPLVYRHEPDRPQPRLDRDSEDGLAWTVGGVRQCNVLDLRYLSITHNTLRGAASGSILNGELLVVQGIVKGWGG